MKSTQQQGRLKKQFTHSAIIIISMEYHADFLFFFIIIIIKAHS